MSNENEVIPGEESNQVTDSAVTENVAPGAVENITVVDPPAVEFPEEFKVTEEVLPPVTQQRESYAGEFDFLPGNRYDIVAIGIKENFLLFLYDDLECITSNETILQKVTPLYGKGLFGNGNKMEIAIVAEGELTSPVLRVFTLPGRIKP